MRSMFPLPEVGQDFLEFRVYFDTPNDGEDDIRIMKQEIEMFLNGYMWQKEPLLLTLSQEGIKGKMIVGDNIEDEWVATAALFHLTKLHNDFTVQVWDVDGDFLLIQAADVLPTWLNPENSANRVFLRRGHVHLIQEDPSVNNLELNVALSHLRSQPLSVTKSNAVEKVILARFQHAERESLKPEINKHRIQVYLPLNAATVFQTLPECIGYAVESFYYREPTESNQICRKMKTFPPSTSNMTRSMITLTRCMYAQLKNQQFAPPKPFVAVMLEPEDPTTELGMKLTCGLELLYSSQMQDIHSTRWRDKMDLVMSSMPHFEQPDICNSDDDSWLHVAPDSLEAMLRQAEVRVENDRTGNEKGEDLQNIATLFNNFVHEMSDYEGVAKSPISSNGVTFNMDSFMKILNGDGKESIDDYFYESEEDDEEENVDDKMDQMMHEMDLELAGSKIHKSFHHDESVADSLKPVNVDFNLVSNLLESLASQEGTAGPVSNMLRDMGFEK